LSNLPLEVKEISLSPGAAGGTWQLGGSLRILSTEPLNPKFGKVEAVPLAGSLMIMHCEALKGIVNDLVPAMPTVKYWG
jgi:hypothetical protein